MKRSLLELNSRQKKKKSKKIVSDEDSEESERSQISLRENSTSLVDLEIDEDADDYNTKHYYKISYRMIVKISYRLIVKFRIINKLTKDKRFYFLLFSSKTIY